MVFVVYTFSMEWMLVALELSVHIAAYHMDERIEPVRCCSIPARDVTAPEWNSLTPGIGLTHGIYTIGGLRDSIGNPSYYGGLVFGREWPRARVRLAALAMYREPDPRYTEDGLLPILVPSVGLKLGPAWVDASYLHGDKRAVLFSVSMGVGRTSATQQ